MTINLADNDPRASYTVAQGASQSAFTVSFEFFDDDDLNIYVDGTLKTLTTDYTLTGGDGSTGTANFVSPVVGATGGSTVVITRSIDLDRTTDFPSSGPFNIASLNTELDRLIAITADLKDQVDRSLKLVDYDSEVDTQMPLLAARKGTVLGFNLTTGVPEAGPQISDVQSLSDVSADIATLADIEDGTEATDAISGLAAIKANVTTAANISGNITTVAGISANVTTVAGNNANVSTVAGISSNVTSVAGVASDVTTVAGIASDVSTVAGDSADIQTVASNIATIGQKATVDEATALAIALGQESNMANEFKVITRDVAPASAGTPETIYTVQTGSTIVVLGLTLANVHNAQVTASVTLVSTTAHTGQTANTTAHIVKDAAIPAGSTLSVLDGKINLGVGDIVKVDCSVADKVSVIMSYMEQT